MMIAEPLQDMLATSLGEVMQNMCFILPWECDEAASTETVWVERTVEFSGPVQGEFRVRAPFSAAAHIASDFLGEDLSSLTEVQINEVMSEMANVVCGNVLGHGYPTNAFTLTSPREPDVQIAWQGKRFAWEDGLVEVWIRSEPNA